MKKIVVLNGSPRKKVCTAALIDEVIKSCEKQGAEIKYYYLNGMNIKPCQGCNYCKTKENICCIQDDMQIILNEIQEAHSIIFGTPVYMWQMSAQLKTMLDRMRSLITAERISLLNPGKKVLLAATQKAKDILMFRDYFEYFGKSLVSLFSFEEYKILIAGGTYETEDVLNQTELLKEAEKMGLWLTE